MGRTTAFRFAALLFLCSFSSAQADELRIHRAERIELRADLTRTTFHAFGRRFDLQLEPNDRILRRLSASQKSRLGDFGVYRGRLAGRDDTWVRLTRFGTELHGAIWDGSELLTVQPARAVRHALAAEIAVPDGDHLVYRLSDTESSLDTGVCGVGNRQMLGGAHDYAALVEELRQRLAAAAVAADQIEIEFVADVQFSSRIPFNTQLEMLARVNIVDGIYSDQVGVTIVPTFRQLTSANDPFVGDDAEDLLSQLGVYRENTPEVRDRGLAHLLTGRNLRLEGDPGVLGIAFIASLCEAFGGVGVSEAADGATVAALIMAHEIGHNFGAPHDAETGSACQSAPRGFLMEPFLNGSDRFSQCSLDQMRPQVQAAACIVPAQYADVTIRIPAPIRAIVGEPFDYVIEAHSQGNQPATGVSVEIGSLGTFAVNSMNAEGGTCSAGPAGSVTCQLGDMPASSARRITLNLTSDFGPRTVQTPATATASNDRIPANNTVSVPVFVGAAADAAVTVTPASLTSPTRQVHTFTATVRSNGPQAATNVRAFFRGSPKMLADSASSPGATCDITFCNLGTLAPGEVRQVVFTARGVSAGAFNVEVEVISDNDDVPVNNRAFSAVVLTAVSDAALGPGVTVNAAVGQPFQLQIPLTSPGQEPVTNVEVRIAVQFPASAVVIESASVVGGTCISAGFEFFNCTLAALPAGSARTVEATLRANAPGVGNVRVWIFSATNDEDPGNNTSTTVVRVRHPADVGVTAAGYSFLELQPFVARIPLRSSGLSEAADVTATITIPAAIALVAANVNGGTCAITQGTVTCTLASLQPDAVAFVDVTLQGNTLGDFLGSVTVDASNDTHAANDSAELRFNVRPFFDAALDAPTSVIGLINETVEIPLTVTTLNQAMPQVSVRADNFDSAVLIESVAASVGTCSVTNSGFGNVVNCVLGDLPARSTVSITLRLRATGARSFTMRAELTAPLDNNAAGNNNRQVAVLIDAMPDARFDPGPIEVTAQVNTTFTTAQSVSVMGIPGIQDLVVTYPLPASITATAATATGGNCAVAAAAVTCSFAQPPGGGVNRGVVITMRATTGGRFPTTATLTATNDSNPGNNSLSLIYVINEPPAPPVSGGGGGGGGGGALGTHLPLALLLLLVAIRRKQGECHVNV